MSLWTNLPPFWRSHAWGSSSHGKNILVNGEIHKVTVSCWDVLYANTNYLLYRDMPIWIDAICINQQDEREKEREVSRMHRIYRKGYVAVNLGGGLGREALRKRDQRAVRALQLLAGRKRVEREDLIWNTSRDENYRWRDANSEADAVVGADIVEDGATENYITDSLPHIIAFLHNPWFSRTWIIQEFTLGLKTPEAPLLSHDALISASTLVAACIALERRSASLSTNLRRALLTGTSRYLRLANAAARHIQGGGSRDLLQYLCMFREQMASDARDKVYSLLGLFQTTSHSASLAYDPHVLPIDYTASLETVYARTVQSIVLATRRIDVLCACQHRSSFVRSWTPDWRQPWRRASLNPHMGIGGKDREGWRACALVEAQVAFSEDLRTIHARSVMYAVVQRVGKKWSERSIENTPSVAEELFYLTGERIQRRTISEGGGDDGSDGKDDNDSGYGTDESTSRHTDDNEALYKHLACAMAATGAPLIPTSENPLHFLPYTSTAWFEKAQRSPPLEAQFIKMGEGRRTMRLSTGSFGLGPEEMDVGDVVCVLFGCSVPVVLRPFEDCFKFIGECYVHEIMRGQLVEALERGEVGEQTFEIH